MSNLDHKLAEALTTHAARLAAHEAQENFPLLRLNKSVDAYRTIATFMTIPPEQRTAVAVACAARWTEEQRKLFEAFRRRMEPHTIEELNQMASRPTPLEPPGPALIAMGADFTVAYLRRRLEGLTRAEIRRCFVGRIREAYEEKVRPCGRGAVLYESVRSVGGWQVVTCLDFGGSYQFRCDFRLKHPGLECSGLYSLGHVLGCGGAGWDDVRRETLKNDAGKALKLCQALRCFFSSVVAGL